MRRVVSPKPKEKDEAKDMNLKSLASRRKEALASCLSRKKESE